MGLVTGAQASPAEGCLAMAGGAGLLARGSFYSPRLPSYTSGVYGFRPPSQLRGSGGITPPSLFARLRGTQPEYQT